MEIASRGIHKGKDNEKGREKTNKNLERLLEEEIMGEIPKVVQVDSSQVVIQNHHNGKIHGQKSNLEQLGPKGIGLRVLRVLSRMKLPLFLSLLLQTLKEAYPYQMLI